MFPFFAFELGREYRLSIAELWKVFPQSEWVYTDQKIAILGDITEKDVFKHASRLGGTIKIIKILTTTNQQRQDSIQQSLMDGIHHMVIRHPEGTKISFALNVYGAGILAQRTRITTAKNIVKNHGFNARFVNKNWQNASSIEIIKEALIAKETDWNLIFDGETTYFGVSIFVQDIYAYSNRDYQKERNMHIGMLPPKLAQIMLNFAGTHPQSVYDPFVGLGTIGIESALAGNSIFFGSDHNEKMVQASFDNLEQISESHPVEYAIFYQDARFLHEIDIWEQVDTMVTEGYLGEIMTQKNISLERIARERKKLSELYTRFFENLQKTPWQGTIVISFPFWNLEGKHIYFEEIYDIVQKFCHVQPLLPANITAQATRSGSLLYKRKDQLVGREIFVLQLKK